MSDRLDAGQRLPDNGFVSGLGRGVAWTSTETIVRLAADVFLVAYAVRRLGFSEFGIFAIATTVTSLFATVDFGLRAIAVRAAARDPHSTADDSARREIATAHAACCAMAGLLVVATLIVMPVLPALLNVEGKEDQLRITMGLVGAGLALNVAGATIVSVATGRRQFHVVSPSSMLGQVVNVAAVTLLLGQLGVIALGVGRLVGAVVQGSLLVWWARRAVPWFGMRPSVPPLGDVRNVTRFALPLLVIASGSQLVAATDLLVIGALGTAASVGVYRASGTVPGRALALLFSGYDASFPFLAREGTDAGDTILKRSSAIFSYLGGLGFGFMIWSRSDIVTLLLGRPSRLGEQVFLLFCLAWMANIPAHGISLVLIARGRHQSFIPLVGAEFAANVVLTIVLVIAMGPIGAAIATLATISVVDYVLLPWVVRHEFETSLARLVVRNGALPTLLGVLVALGPSAVAGGPRVIPLVLVGVVTLAVGSGVGMLALKHEGRAFVRAAVSQGSR